MHVVPMEVNDNDALRYQGKLYAHIHTCAYRCTHKHAHTYPNIPNSDEGIIKELLYLSIKECGCVDGQLWWYEHLQRMWMQSQTKDHLKTVLIDWKTEWEGRGRWGRGERKGKQGGRGGVCVCV